MMALIWSIGGTTTYSGRTIFDEFLRSKIKDAQSNVSIPAQGLVYDFVFDFKTGEWKRWLTTIPAYTVNPNTNFSQALSRNTNHSPT